VIVNASPLIWLAKIGKLSLLKTLYGQVLIPSEVYIETVEKGLEHEFRDAIIIKEACEQGWIKTIDLDNAQTRLRDKILASLKELDRGEVEAIVYAKTTKADLILLDGSTARAFAESWEIKAKGTLYVILKAYRQGALTKNETKESILNLVEKGFRIDPKLLTKIIKQISQ
jgi:predicted nucleic acid-binding protein